MAERQKLWCLPACADVQLLDLTYLPSPTVLTNQGIEAQARLGVETSKSDTVCEA